MSYYNLTWIDQTTGVTRETTFVNRQHDGTSDLWSVGQLCGLTNTQVIEECNRFLQNFEHVNTQYTTVFDIKNRYDETLQMLKWTVTNVKTAAEKNENTTCHCSEFPSNQEGKNIMEAFQPSSGLPVTFMPFIRVVYPSPTNPEEPEIQDIKLSSDNCKAVYRVLYENGEPYAQNWLRLSQSIRDEK